MVLTCKCILFLSWRCVPLLASAHAPTRGFCFFLGGVSLYLRLHTRPNQGVLFLSWRCVHLLASAHAPQPGDVHWTGERSGCSHRTCTVSSPYLGCALRCWAPQQRTRLMHRTLLTPLMCRTHRACHVQVRRMVCGTAECKSSRNPELDSTFLYCKRSWHATGRTA
jgi:hypothetical protein